MVIEKPLTVTQAAEQLNLSEACIRAWILHRRLGVVRLGRAVRIPQSEIRRVLDEGTMPARIR
jgi:excisionase family DNA binding protein